MSNTAPTTTKVYELDDQTAVDYDEVALEQNQDQTESETPNSSEDGYFAVKFLLIPSIILSILLTLLLNLFL